MNLSQSIVHDVDAAPLRIPVFHTEPVEIVAWLMDATYENKSQTEKGTAYATQTRARLVLDRYRKRNVN